MARYQLIDTYLDVLAAQLSWRGDREDLDSEVSDHLYCAVERAVAGGTEVEAAQRAVLDRFGDPGVVAAAFATSGSKGLALPTPFTTSAGLVAKFAAASWAMIAIGWTVSYLNDRDGSWDLSAQIPYFAGAFALLSACAFTVVLLLALDQRHGGLGLLGRAGAALAGLGAIASIFGWFIFGWGVLIGVGSLLVSAAVLKRDLAPRAPVIIMAGSWNVALLLVPLLEALEVGRLDDFGDRPLAQLTAILFGCAGTAVGVLGVGRWLGSESPVAADFADSIAARPAP